MSTQKYRIISKHNNKLLNPSFFIQRKSFFFWKNITITENRESKELKFDAYEDAEAYMREKYFSTEGEIFKPSQNEYHYTQYSYYYF